MEPKTMKLILTILVSVSALVSAIYWVKSARTTVMAESQTGGFGAVLGGGMIIQGPRGERIDLHATMNEQSRWNRYAAYSAALCAFAQFLLTFY